MALRALSLCAGIGGIDVGLRGIARTVCYVERDPDAVRVLTHNIRRGLLDDAPIWDDITTFDARAWRGVDLVQGGPPCQAFSTASRGRPVAADLFDEAIRVVRDAEPNFVFFENVVGARKRLLLVREELTALGYCVPPIARVAAASVGAPHRRPRLWLLAYAHGQEQRLRALNAEMAGLSPFEGVAWDDEDLARRLSTVADGVPAGVAGKACRQRRRPSLRKEGLVRTGLACILPTHP